MVIPEDRLAWLDTLTLYNGAHKGAGGPDCQHGARELLYEVVTGMFADRNPPRATRFASILPSLNNGPWRDDAHRTEVLRPYLRKFLPLSFGGLDPANDKVRVYALLDHSCHKTAPQLLELLGLTDEADTLRALGPIDYAHPPMQPIIEEVARALNRASAFDPTLTLNYFFTRNFDLALTYTHGQRRVFDFATTLIHAHTRAHVHIFDLTIEKRAEHWEHMVRELLDIIWSIP